MSLLTYRTHMNRCIKLARKIHAKPILNQNRFVKVLKIAAGLNDRFPDHAANNS